MKDRQYPTGPAPTQVYLFATCLVDMFVPQAGLDAVRLLEREGLAVHFPRGQSCCGQPAYSSGNPDAARAVARAQLDLFSQPWHARATPILTGAIAGPGTAIRAHAHPAPAPSRHNTRVSPRHGIGRNISYLTKIC
jgi:hypothetical protein